MSNSICVIGNYGDGNSFCDGQTIKTKTITEELQKKYGNDAVSIFNTNNSKKQLLSLPFKLLKIIKNNKNVIILPAQNGIRLIVPLLSLINRKYKRRIHYIVIGGWLPNFVEKRKKLKKDLQKLDYIYVETRTMKEALEKQGFNNVLIMPNCKNLKIVDINQLNTKYEAPYKLCTFSRVMKEKGIEDAINAVKRINEKENKTIFTLDIYGQVDNNQKDWFEKLKESFPKYVSYKGIVDYDKSVDVLKNYYALLFPTYYDGEGFAGTLIDALASGTPIIASNWKYNSEIVNEKNGFLFEVHNLDALEDILEKLPSIDIWKLKKNSIEDANNYHSSKVINILYLE